MQQNAKEILVLMDYLSLTNYQAFLIMRNYMSKPPLLSHIQPTSISRNNTQKPHINTSGICNRTLIRFIVFICLLTNIEATCYTSDRFSACQICLNQDRTEVLSCYFNKNPNYPNCRSICCPYSYSSISVPASCNDSSNSGGSISISTIIIIIVFSLPVAVCIILLIHSCIVGINRTPTQAARPSRQERNAQTAINLQQFNMEQAFPYHIDRQQVCSICLEPQCHVMTLCGHTYHSPCLRAWIKKKESCAFCVSQQFNPLGIFCTTCGKSIRLKVMYSRMPSVQKLEWQEATTVKCSNCENAGRQQEIEISLGEEEIQRYQKTVVVPKVQMGAGESRQSVLPKQSSANNFT